MVKQGFYQTSPCLQCPFKTDLKGHLYGGWILRLEFNSRLIRGKVPGESHSGSLWVTFLHITHIWPLLILTQTDGKAAGCSATFPNPSAAHQIWDWLHHTAKEDCITNWRTLLICTSVIPAPCLKDFTKCCHTHSASHSSQLGPSHPALHTPDLLSLTPSCTAQQPQTAAEATPSTPGEPQKHAGTSAKLMDLIRDILPPTIIHS